MYAQSLRMHSSTAPGRTCTAEYCGAAVLPAAAVLPSASSRLQSGLSVFAVLQARLAAEKAARLKQANVWTATIAVCSLHCLCYVANPNEYSAATHSLQRWQRLRHAQCRVHSLTHCIPQPAARLSASAAAAVSDHRPDAAQLLG